MPLAKPLYLTTDFSDLTEEEIKRVNWAISRKIYQTEKYGPERQRRANLAKNFGISLEDYNLILDFQDKKCAICGTDKCGNSGRGFRKCFSVDHDHTTNDIRGLLCGHCNLALGLFKDNINSLQKAIEYLNHPPVSEIKKRGIALGTGLEEFKGRRSPKERTDINTDDIVAFYKASPNNSLREAEKEFGISDAQILQRLKKAGVPRRGNHQGRVCPEGTSWCSGHKEFFPIDQFWKDPGRPNGLASQCKECRAKIQRKAYEKTRLKNKESVVQ